jgi:4-oxalmesaconate hydratase
MLRRRTADYNAGEVKMARFLGGVVRYDAVAQDTGVGPLEDLLLKNVYFDTCVYHRPGRELLLKMIPADNIPSATKMVGAVCGNDLRSGYAYDDTKR